MLYRISKAIIDTVLLLYLKHGAVDLPNSSLPCTPSLRIGLSIRETDMVHARTTLVESGHDGRSGGYFRQGRRKGASAIFYTNTCPALVYTLGLLETDLS